MFERTLVSGIAISILYLVGLAAIGFFLARRTGPVPGVLALAAAAMLAWRAIGSAAAAHHAFGIVSNRNGVSTLPPDTAATFRLIALSSTGLAILAAAGTGLIAFRLWRTHAAVRVSRRPAH